MRKLSVFNTVSLDGYFTDAKGDMNWAHASHDDAEWNEFVAGNAGTGGMLVFGRVTYQMMASFWPTPQATAAMPAVAQGMNRMPKLTFSRTLRAVDWANTVLATSEPATEITRLKAEPGPDMVILGSGTIVAQLAQAGLIDTYQIVIKPVVLGAGRTLFEGIDPRLTFRRESARTFQNGNVFLEYSA